MRFRGGEGPRPSLTWHSDVTGGAGIGNDADGAIAGRPEEVAAAAAGLGEARGLSYETVGGVDGQAVVAAIDEGLELLDRRLGGLRQGGDAQENHDRDELWSRHG